MEAAEEAMDLRVGGGGSMPAPEKRLPFVGLRGMAGARLDRRRRSLTGRDGEVREGAPATGGVGSGSAGSRVAVGSPEVEKKTLY
jgi:hypothetical protein